MSVKGYYRYPTLHRELIAFVAEDDLWLVGDQGGVAQRLTANPGIETYPRFSPDGNQIAFVSRDEGPPEAFVMPTSGGAVERLSYFGASTIVAGWSRGGEAVLVASDYKQPFAGWMHLFRIPTDGSPASPLNIGPAFSLSQPARGRGLVIGRNAYDPARWKRYRGGRTGSLWIDRSGQGKYTPLVELEGNLASPIWLGSRVFFLSDHEGHGNLYSVTPAGKDLGRHTNHSDFYVRHPTGDGQRIVYHCGADLWLYDPESDTSQRLEITLPSSQPQRQRRLIEPGKFVSSVDLHPNGYATAVTVRGRVHSLALWEGAPRPHGTAGPFRQRLGTWLGDGQRIAWVTDQDGEESVVIGPAKELGEEKVIRRDFGRIRSISAAPTGTPRLALTNHRHDLLLLQVNRSSVKPVYHSPFHWIDEPSWSPDGRWLAFAASVTRTTSNIFLYDTRNGRLHQVDRPRFFDRSPSFDPEGKFLFFLSGRSFDPVPDTHFHDYGFPQGMQPYLLTLAADTPSPFSPTDKTPYPPGGSPLPAPETKGRSSGTKSERPETVIDLAGLDDRVVEIPVPAGIYGDVSAALGRVFMLKYPQLGGLKHQNRLEPLSGSLYAWDFGTERRELVAEGVRSYTISTDGKVVAYLTNSRLRAHGVKDKPDSGSTPSRSTGWVDLTRIRVEVNPPFEWQQMFTEAWRLQQDYFWHQDMTGVNWVAVLERYGKLVGRVASRWEFSDLLWEMQGELGTSHAYELGGDYLPQPNWTQGSLGADLDFERGRWRISRIPNGDSWKPEGNSPLSTVGAPIRAADVIWSVDGQELSRHLGPEQLLMNRAGKPVELEIRRGRTKPRKIAVIPLGSERLLRYRDWVEKNREQVSAATDGQAGYLHIPDMSAWGFSEFHRSWQEVVDREGLLIDVRFNRGGSVSQLLLEKLLRRRIGFRITRWRLPFAFPVDSPAGPMVCLTNEMAGSDGDIFSHAFKQHRLGPLIGTRTWGGVIGIWPQQALVDGTVTTQPEFSTWFQDVGFGVENYGTDPDIVIPITPADYQVGRDPQLERGIQELSQLMESQPEPPQFGPPPSTKAPRLPET